MGPYYGPLVLLGGIRVHIGYVVGVYNDPKVKGPC